jgi:anti-anti-sigma factor
MRITPTTHGPDTAVLAIEGTLLSTEEVDALRNAVAGMVNKHYKRLALDLSGTTFMNSAAVGVLVAAHTSYVNRKWRFCLFGVNQSIGIILALTRLNILLTICADRDEALAFLQKTP